MPGIEREWVGRGDDTRVPPPETVQNCVLSRSEPPCPHRLHLVTFYSRLVSVSTCHRSTVEEQNKEVQGFCLAMPCFLGSECWCARRPSRRLGTLPTARSSTPRAVALFQRIMVRRVVSLSDGLELRFITARYGPTHPWYIFTRSSLVLGTEAAVQAWLRRVGRAAVRLAALVGYDTSLCETNKASGSSAVILGGSLLVLIQLDHCSSFNTS